jgi:hypothetical protein
MTEVRESCELGASAHQAWTLISDFGGFAEMLVASRDGTVQVSSAAPSSRRTMVREDWAWLLLLALLAGAETGPVRRGRSRLPQWCR